ncbi:hypothetical protein BH23BAC1_BH23BAC1_00060 [soil metagenome]
MHPDTFKLTLLLIIIGIIGSIILGQASGTEIASSRDSLVYVEGANQIIKDGSFAVEKDGQHEVITRYPPFYSFLLALVSQFGLSVFSAAKVLNFVLFAANIFLAGYLFYRITGGNLSWSVAFANIILLAWPVIDIHLRAWPEPLLIFLTNLGFLYLAEFFNKPRINTFLMAALFLALAPMTRYSGIIPLIVGCLSIIFYFNFELNKRAITAVLFAFISSLPLLLWLFRNYWLAGNTTGRAISFSLITFDELGDITETISSWFFYFGINDNYRIYAFFILLLLLFLLLSFNLNQRKIHLLYQRSKQNLHINKIFGLFIFCYLFYVGVYISFFGDGIPVNNKLLVPIFIPFLAVVFRAFYQWQKFSENNTAYKTTVSILIVIFMITSAGYFFSKSTPEATPDPETENSEIFTNPAIPANNLFPEFLSVP